MLVTQHSIAGNTVQYYIQILALWILDIDYSLIIYSTDLSHSLFIYILLTKTTFLYNFCVFKYSWALGFQSFSLDIGCFFTNFFSLAFDFFLLYPEECFCKSFKHKKAPNSSDESVLCLQLSKEPVLKCNFGHFVMSSL